MRSSSEDGPASGPPRHKWDECVFSDCTSRMIPPVGFEYMCAGSLSPAAAQASGKGPPIARSALGGEGALRRAVRLISPAVVAHALPGLPPAAIIEYSKRNRRAGAPGSSLTRAARGGASARRGSADLRGRLIHVLLRTSPAPKLLASTPPFF